MRIRMSPCWVWAILFLLSGAYTVPKCEAFVPTTTITGKHKIQVSFSGTMLSRKRQRLISTTTELPSAEGREDGSEDSAAEVPDDDDFIFIAPMSPNFDADYNEQRYSASDWLSNIRSLPRSTILRAIQGPVLTVMVWSFCVSIIHGILKRLGPEGWASHICISGKPHSFLVSSLGLLLVFRTNSAYQRFAEGRKIWENILSVSRNISRLATLYEKDLGGERRHRILRLLGAFPYLLHRHIIPGTGCLDPKEYQQLKGTKFAMKLNESVDRTEKVDYYSDLSNTLSSGNIVSYLYSTTKDKVKRTFQIRRRSRRFINGNGNGDNQIYRVEASSNDPNDYDDEECDICMVDKRSLPWCLLPPSALRKLTTEKVCPPLWCCDRMAADICEVPFSTIFTSRERLTFLSQIDKLSKSIGECERIHQTAVPLNYARHSLRSLTIWLFSLPFALVADFGLLTAPVMGVISWLLFGVYQIGYTIEDPFQGSLRLSVLCDLIYRDVMYDADLKSTRDSAFHMEEEFPEWNRMGPPSNREARVLLSPLSDSPKAEVKDEPSETPSNGKSSSRSTDSDELKP